MLGLKAEPAPLRGLEWQGLHSPLVGREAEFASVKECLERLLAGQGGILGIFGEAGIGKSRLMGELHQNYPKDRLCWLEGHSLSYGSSIPYWPFQEILRDYAGINDQDSENRAWDKLESQIRALFPEQAVGTTPTVAEILPYLASLLGLEVRDEYLEWVKYLDGEALGKQIYLASRRFFEQLAGSRPVVLVFEDLHWMDASSISLLEHLLPLVEQTALLIAILSRPSWEAPADHLMGIIEKDHVTRYTAIRLAPLTQSDSARLVHNLLEIEALPGEVRDMILSKAEGNPFFLEEILRNWIGLGAIRREASSGRWQATEKIEQFVIPSTVQGVILSRLDRLEEGVKQVLRVASVIGRSFLYRVLRAVTEVGEVLDDDLIELKRLELIQEKQRKPELEYLFKHVLAQETTYESILLEKRRELHARVGGAIETLFADRLEEFYGLLAHHYAKAEVWRKAQAYLLKAADQAGRMAADVEALDHYQEALAAYGRVFGKRWDPVERSILERKMGEAFFRRGEWAQAIDSLRRALATLEHPLPTSWWAVRFALWLEIAQEIVRWLLPRLLPKSEPGPAAKEELAIYQALGYAVGVSDHELFLLLSFRMLNFSERNSMPASVAVASAGLGIAFSFQNFPRLAEHYNQRAMRLARQLQRPDVLGFANTGLMSLEVLRNMWEAALEHGRQGAEAFRKIGNLGSWSVSIRFMVILSLWRGDFARALVYSQEMVQTGLDSADHQVWSAGLASQGSVEQRLGLLEQAITHLKQAIELTEASGNHYLRVLTANELGRCYLRQAQWQTAMDILNSNSSFIVQHNFKRAPHPNAMLRNILAATYLLAAEQGEPQERNAWLKKAKHACQAALRWGKALRAGKPEALRLQGRYEWLKGNAAQARRWWQKSLVEAETLGMPYELGLTRLEIGQRLGEHPHLEKAKAIFSEIGAERDLVQASELLKEDLTLSKLK